MTALFRNDRIRLKWRRDGSDWQLLAGRRRFGRVMPDPNCAGMWRSTKTFGHRSDMANLGWAKNAVLVAAERELEWELGQQAAINPSKCPEKGGVFRPKSSPVRQNGSAARRERNALSTHPGAAP